MTRQEQNHGKAPSACPAEGVLLACQEGRLPEADAATVRAHCTSCDACSAILLEYERLESVLDRHTVAPVGSVWPEVHARLRPRPSPLARAAFSFGSAVAVAAGLFIGFAVVPWQESAPVASWQQDTWVEMGSLLADPTSYGSLDDVYWDLASEEGEDSR